MTTDNIQLTNEEIVDQYADMVYRIACNEMGSTADAEDVFQEVFMRLVKYRKKLKSEEHLKAWLIRVTINCARKQQGSSWRKKVSSLDEDSAGEIADERTASEYERLETQDSGVTRAVADLPEHYRIVVYLFYYEELSISQIGEALGEKESTIKSRLHRARELLKTALDGEV